MDIAIDKIFSMNAPWMENKPASLLLFLVCLGLALYSASPKYNWDMIPYIGVMYSYDIDDSILLHKKTYNTIKSGVPGHVYDVLSSRGDYRLKIARNPKYFKEQLPFYSVKPAYPSLLYVLNKAGIQPVIASTLISKISFVGIAILIFIWTSKYLPKVAASVLTSSVIFLPNILDLAALSTPDSMSAFFILLCFYLLIETKYIGKALIILPISILIRPDSLILVIPVTLYFLTFQTEYRLKAIISLVLTIGLYTIVTAFSGNYGWSTLFYHGFVGLLLQPSTFESTLGFDEYLRIYKNRFDITLHYGNFTMYLFLNIIAFFIAWERKGIRNLSTVLLMITFIYMLAHWVVFPLEKERQVAGAFIFSVIIIINNIMPKKMQIGLPP